MGDYFFSIITVTLNCAEEFKETLKSIEFQKFSNYQLIVIDGHSTDNTIEIIKNSKLVNKYISEKDEGIYDAMNKGIDMAEGKYLLFLNAGDRFVDPYVLYDISRVAEEEKYLFIYGNTLMVKDEITIDIIGKPIKKQLLYPNFPFVHQAVFFHRTLFKKVGKYNKRYQIAGDVEWFMRFFNSYDGYKYTLYIDRDIVIFEVGGASTKKRLKGIKEKYECQRKYISKIYSPYYYFRYGCGLLKGIILYMFEDTLFWNIYRRIKVYIKMLFRKYFYI